MDRTDTGENLRAGPRLRHAEDFLPRITRMARINAKSWEFVFICVNPCSSDFGRLSGAWQKPCGAAAGDFAAGGLWTKYVPLLTNQIYSIDWRSSVWVWVVGQQKWVPLDTVRKYSIEDLRMAIDRRSGKCSPTLTGTEYSNHSISHRWPSVGFGAAGLQKNKCPPLPTGTDYSMPFWQSKAAGRLEEKSCSLV